MSLTVSVRGPKAFLARVLPMEKSRAPETSPSLKWHSNSQTAKQPVAASDIKERTIKFAGYYTAAHRTTGWEYFITKPGWNPNRSCEHPFDTAPFCIVSGNGLPPIHGSVGGSSPGNEKHTCVVPDHVILGLWTVDDTASAFHKVVDVNIIADGGPGEPVDGLERWATSHPSAP